MLNRTGVLAIAALLVGFAVIHLGFSHSQAGMPVTGSNLLGGFAFLLMTVSLVLATRAPVLEGLFGGLDRMYQVHKFCGVFAGLLVLVHFFASPKSPPAGMTEAELGAIPSSPMGMLAMILLVISLAITLNRKIAYHRWRLPHKAMGVVYLLITAHVMTAPTVFFDKFGPSGFIIIGAAFIGILAYLYSLVGLNAGKRHDYVIETVNPLERATEVVLKPTGQAMDHRPGQFAFLHVDGADLKEPHPFTISSAPGASELRFTIKVLGDWTRAIRDQLKPGTKARVHGPYGLFQPELSNRKQIWVAGGVGVTPFLSTLRSLPEADKVERCLVYGVRERSEALFLGELEEADSARENFKLVILESNKGDFVQVDVMESKLVDDLEGYDYFLCGPKPMIAGVMKDLKQRGVPRSQIHTEAFEFR